MGQQMKQTRFVNHDDMIMFLQICKQNGCSFGSSNSYKAANYEYDPLLSRLTHGRDDIMVIDNNASTITGLTTCYIFTIRKRVDDYKIATIAHTHNAITIATNFDFLQDIGLSDRAN